jgi:hypothetical protein
MRKPAAIAVFFSLVLLPSSWVHASQKTYEAGKLLSIKSPEVLLPIPVSPGQTFNWPMHFSYEFEIQQGDVVYIGYCQKSEYKAEWHVGDETQFRLVKDKIYLRRPNGKELRLVFLLQAKLGADGKPVTILKQKR